MPKIEVQNKLERFQILHEIKVKIEEIDIATAIECGFHIDHVTGTAEDGTTLKMTSGAGCGNRWIQATIEKPNEETVHFRIDTFEMLCEIAKQLGHAELDDGSSG